MVLLVVRVVVVPLLREYPLISAEVVVQLLAVELDGPPSSRLSWQLEFVASALVRSILGEWNPQIP